ncbi:MAG: hypothetical protein UY24_C0016G0001, partial [Parcubacteria group bacterium GW2011_GWA1_48_11b]
NCIIITRLLGNPALGLAPYRVASENVPIREDADR